MNIKKNVRVDIMSTMSIKSAVADVITNIMNNMGIRRAAADVITSIMSTMTAAAAGMIMATCRRMSASRCLCVLPWRQYC